MIFALILFVTNDLNVSMTQKILVFVGKNQDFYFPHLLDVLILPKVVLKFKNIVSYLAGFQQCIHACGIFIDQPVAINIGFPDNIRIESSLVEPVFIADTLGIISPVKYLPIGK